MRKNFLPLNFFLTIPVTLMGGSVPGSGPPTLSTLWYLILRASHGGSYVYLPLRSKEKLKLQEVKPLAQGHREVPEVDFESRSI